VKKVDYFRCLLMVLLTGMILASTGLGQSAVELKSNQDNDSVEVWIGGDLFTSYRYGGEFTRKPVFYPVIAPNGVMVNRELPQVRPEVAEEQDHPHHESLFMGYGDVDSYDFWSNLNGEKIEHRAVLNKKSGDQGLLEILLDWNEPGGLTLIREIRRIVFGGSENCRWMDHDITLNAGKQSRVFMDTKEGLFAIRLADELKESDGTGRYINAYGWETAENVWGKRCPWVAIRGTVKGSDVTVAIFDHPSTENFPSYWHARDYGLFSVNPFGRKDFVKGSTPLGKKLDANDSFHFRYRLLVYSGQVSKDRLDQDYWNYVK
jgi:Family of unknown function (DUF6807)